MPGATNQQQQPGGAGPAGRSGPRRLWLAVVAGAVVGGLLVGGIVAAALALQDDEPAVVARPAIVTPEGVMDIQAILDKVQESVVTIETTAGAGGGVFEGAGTGIVLSEDGLVLTNAHVIGGSDEIQVRLFDGANHSASLVGSSPDEDLAVIRVDGVDDMVPAELGSSDSLQVGEPVIAIGNALNLGGQPSVTQGIVSAKDRSIQGPGAGGEDVDLDNLVQTDAAINPGNSGGPLVDVSGQVVGVNTAIIADSQNIGFAIAIDPVKSQIEDLQNGGGEITPDTAFLGVSTIDVSTVEDAVRTQLGIRAEKGAFVAEVTNGTGADDAGLRAGDVIVSIDGDPVDTSTAVADAVREHEPGDEIRITIEREGKEQTLTATLGRRGG
ncbi:MAG TPA: trypsin-like peptidase domain-containing protein [Acidimicrobiales bacterium]|nr:trypsin-like peptidase domain-containing protein [Acidimicrobiales bacterium]